MIIGMAKLISLSVLFFRLLFFGSIISTYSPEVSAAPGGMGGGPVCPPACPPNPANCDANLVITATQDLQFGSMTAGTGGSVIVDTAGVATPTGTVLLLAGGAAAASFNMSTGAYTCTNRALVTVTAGPNATLTHATLPANTMAVDTFTLSLAPGDLFTSPMTVGATLNVGSSQEPGPYTGTFLVTVTFQ